MSLFSVGVASAGLMTMLMLMIMPLSIDGMKINVKYSQIIEKTIAIDVEGTDTVETLKEKTHKAIGKNAKFQTLRLNDSFSIALEDNKTMEKCGIKDGEIIRLSFGEFQIDVNYGKKRHPVHVKGTDTVETLKKRIENIDKFGNIPHQNQVLIEWDIGLMNDNETMRKCQIRRDVTVVVCRDEFKIAVKAEEKESVTIKVKYNEKVKDLKRKIEEKGISQEKQKVIYSYNKIISEESTNDNSFIYKHNIIEGMTIYVSSDGFKIFVGYKKDGQLYDQNLSVFIYVKGTDTVETVKDKIRALLIEQEQNAKFEAEIRLSKSPFNGQNVVELEDDKTMDHYGIKEQKKGHEDWIYMKLDN